MALKNHGRFKQKTKLSINGDVLHHCILLRRDRRRSRTGGRQGFSDNSGRALVQYGHKMLHTPDGW